MDKEGSTGKTEQTKKHFWRDYDPITKFNFIIALFAIISSVATIGLYCIAKDTLIVSQRAFVYAEKANILGEAPDLKISRPANAKIGIDVVFKNSGQTLSKNQRSTMGTYFTTTGIPDDFKYPIELNSRPILLAPQAETQLLRPISETELANVKSGKQLLFVYGDVTYEDVFGKSHKTEYCFQLFGYSLKPTGELEEYIFYTGPTHNCADEDCKEE